MAQVITFKSKATKIEEWLEDSKNNILESGSDQVLIAARCKNGDWLTGYFGLNYGEKNEALGHIQADIIDQMILANLDRYSL